MDGPGPCRGKEKELGKVCLTPGSEWKERAPGRLRI